jgi:DNA-binding NarL/FixJ family response regulator
MKKLRVITECNAFFNTSNTSNNRILLISLIMVEDLKVLRVLIVEDDDFTRSFVSEMLATTGLRISSANSVSQAISQIDDFDPHVIVTDLDLGTGPDGADLLNWILENRPWVGMVIMTNHASPELVIDNVLRIPDVSIYVVKSEISSISELLLAIEQSIGKKRKYQIPLNSSSKKIKISASQADTLRMLANGSSNASIANERGITLRAAEALIQRTFIALGVNSDSNVNPRVAAVRMWHQGKVAIK